jgi:hypothetical protein
MWKGLKKKFLCLAAIIRKRMSFSFVGIAIKAPFLDYNDRVCEKNR